MSFLLRVVLPDRPGSLGALATALGEVGADIVSLDVVERAPGLAVDDIVVELPAGRLVDSVLSAALTVPEVRVEAIRPYAGAVDTHRELELIEGMAAQPRAAGALLVAALPRIFRASWALEVRSTPEGPVTAAASSAAPELTDVTLPWLPVEHAGVLDPNASWVPSSWQTLGTELAAAPVGRPTRAVLIGRAGGPEFRPSEVLRLAHLGGIAATVENEGDTESTARRERPEDTEGANGEELPAPA